VSSLESQLASGGEIRMLTLAIAGWCRYLQGVADDGSALVLSGDPFLAEATTFAARSLTDPTAFLQYERALGPNLASSTRLAEVFTEALNDLVPASLPRSLASHPSASFRASTLQ
jgi:mannitol 2-dehydrogenase